MAGIPAAKVLHAFRFNRIDPRSQTANPGKVLIFATDQAEIWLRNQRKTALPSRFEAITYLNFPGLFGSLLVDRFTTWPDDWTPAWAEPLGLWGWRALSWPIFCLPFWWLAGRGLDSFFASLASNGTKQRIPWFEAWGFAMLGIIILVLCFGLAVMTNSHDEFPAMRWLFVPGILWFISGLISLLAWWRQPGVRSTTAETHATA